MNRKNKCVILFAIGAVLMFFVPAPARAEDGVAVSQDGTPIAFSVYGEGEPALIFVHGWCCNRSVWKTQVPYFEKEYKVVTLDLAGHGASGTERDVYSMEAFGEDVAAVVRQIQASQIILIGHSMSGGMIIEAAEIIPDHVIALIGIDTMQDFEETYTPEQIEEHLKPFRDDFKTTVDSFVRGMFVEGTDPKLMDDVAGMMSGASQKTGVSAME
ncbi:MAG TPA: alpha/beta hydrolase, partial [Candidatus Omnitrophota bacterium]|nr:alpha/beta hydrolase [Candidatus Omnitrophota bacterium]